jgi:predicted MPP superfamily phosphohydrolase
MLKLLDTAAVLLNLVGHVAAGTFVTNRVLIGAPERLPKVLLILGHMALWPLLGLANVLAIRRRGFLWAILLPNTLGRAWGLFFTLLGARSIAQELYRKSHPITPPLEVLGTTVRRVDLRDEISRHEDLPTSGLRGVVNKLNEMHNLEIVTHTVQLRALPKEFDGFTIVQVSDVHYMRSASAEFIRRYVHLVLEMSPDLVALTGDYQTYPQDIERAARLLAPFGEWSRAKREGLGAVAVLGNHDHEAGQVRVANTLRRADILVLSNGHIELKRGTAALYIAGVTDPWSGRADLDRALHGIPRKACTVLLAHVPDFLARSAGRVDLQLSGHNHGGQVKLPLLGALLVSSCYGRRYVEGFYRRGRTLMYVSRGIGGKPAIRLNSKPEITRFVLRS